MSGGGNFYVCFNEAFRAMKHRRVEKLCFGSFDDNLSFHTITHNPKRWRCGKRFKEEAIFMFICEDSLNFCSLWHHFRDGSYGCGIHTKIREHFLVLLHYGSFEHIKNYTPSRVAVENPSDVCQCEMKTELFLFYRLRDAVENLTRERSTWLERWTDGKAQVRVECLQNFVFTLNEVEENRHQFLTCSTPRSDKNKNRKNLMFDDKGRKLLLRLGENRFEKAILRTWTKSVYL